jgi:hypothetical protein
MDQSGSSLLSPRLREILAALDPLDRQAVTDLVAMYAEFPAWAVRVPRWGQEWRAVRSASGRGLGVGMPLVWVSAATAEDAARRMRRVDVQLSQGQ